MKMKKKKIEKRLDNMLAFSKSARKEMNRYLDECHGKTSELLRSQLKEWHTKTAEARIALSKQVAELRLSLAGKVNLSAVSDPGFIPRYFSRRASWGFDEGDHSEFAGGSYINDWIKHQSDPRRRQQEEGLPFPEDFPEINNVADLVAGIAHSLVPVIVDCPETIEAGFYYTLTGFGFGSTARGLVYIDDIAALPGQSIKAHISSWSDKAISFKIPDDAEGIPFDATGKLYVETANGRKTYIDVIVEPQVSFVFCDQVLYSDDGSHVELDFTPFSYEYKRKKTLKSPHLPSQYRLSEHGLLTVPGLYLEWRDKSSLSNIHHDAGCKVTILKRPYEGSNRLKIEIKITDDWHWDYTVKATFFILVPIGFHHPGWHN